MAKIQARATVRIVLTIDLPGAWNDDCTVGQVMKQTQDGALEKAQQICSLLREKGIRATIEDAGMARVQLVPES